MKPYQVISATPSPEEIPNVVDLERPVSVALIAVLDYFITTVESVVT